MNIIQYWTRKHPDGEFMVIVGIQVYVAFQKYTKADESTSFSILMRTID